MARLGFLLLVFFLTLASARGAHAAGFDLFIDPVFGSTEDTGSKAIVRFEFSEAPIGDLLTLTFTNSTPPTIGSKLTAVGLEVPRWLVDPTEVTVLKPHRYFDTLTFDEDIPPGWLDAPGGYDWIFTSDGSFLGNSPQGAPTAGESDSIVLNLGNTQFSASDLAIGFRQFYASQTDRFVIGRFQAVGLHGEGSDKVSGGVPEPATLVLLAVGAMVLVRGHRLRRAAL